MNNQYNAGTESFTKDKYPEFAVFYNIAYFRIKDLIEHLVKTKKGITEKEKTDTTYPPKPSDERNDYIYSRLREYLWKGYLTDKNRSGYELNDHDKDRIYKILSKLDAIRNIHSHYYHDSKELDFSNDLKQFICALHDGAKGALAEKYAKDFEKYEDSCKKFPLFLRVNNKNIITTEGRTFFLSFFLTRGEMSRFLQQRKGSKRNDTPAFKIKHEIYRYYTHRDGASRHYFGYNETILKSLSLNEQKHVNNARQAFKVITYLNDIPEISNSPDLWPLYTSDEKEVSNAREIINWCQERKFFEGIELNQVYKTIEKNVDGKVNQEEVCKEQIVEVLLPEEKSYSIHLHRVSLHRLIIDSLRREDKGDFVLRKIKQFIEERKYLLAKLERDELFNSVNENEKITLTDELDEYYRYKLRSGRQLKNKMGIWLDQINKRNQKRYPEALRDFMVDIKNTPIEVNYYDFSFEADRKPRPSDKFTEFVAQYLIDFDVVPDWEWMVERFDTAEKEVIDASRNKKVVKHVHKRLLSFTPEVPEGQRLAIRDGQLIVTDSKLGRIPEKEQPDFKFLIGHRTLKNLAAAHIDGKDIKAFLKPIISELKKLRAANGPEVFNQCKLITKKELPEAILNQIEKEVPLDVQRKVLEKKIKCRIEFIVEELEKYINPEFDKRTVSRAEKNRQIMRCYKYFDWSYPNNSEYKFLRKNEYQQLTVYHYCLDKRGMNKDLKRGKNSFLLKDILNHMPHNVQWMLKKANSLDELLELVAEATIQELEKFKNQLPVLKGKGLEKVRCKLGVPGVGIEAFSSHIPFAIHPVLPLRVNYKKEDITKISLSGKIRNNEECTNGLDKSHYNFLPYLNCLPTDNGSFKSKRRRLIGKVNELLTEDAILWYIAKKYLEQTNPAVKEVSKNLKNETGEGWVVGSLRQEQVLMEKMDIPEIGSVQIRLKFHQLDDYLLIESRPVVQNAVKQLFVRFKTPDEQETIGILRDNEQGVFIIPYDEVHKEVQRVYNQSINWAGYLLKFERNVVKCTSHEVILSKANKEGELSRLSFLDVCELAGLKDENSKALLETLIKIRNHCFHAQIPSDWSYEEMENDQALCSLLGYEKKQKNDYLK